MVWNRIKTALWQEAEAAVNDIRHELVERAAYGREVTENISPFEALYGPAAARDVPMEALYGQAVVASTDIDHHCDSEMAARKAYLRPKLEEQAVGRADDYLLNTGQTEVLHPHNQMSYEDLYGKESTLYPPPDIHQEHNREMEQEREE